MSMANAVAAPATEVIEGTVLTVRFHNPANGWTVLTVSAAGEPLTAVGTLVNPRENDEYEFRGRWVTHSKFGRQFQFEQAELRLPSTKKGIIRYLSSIAYGVGEVRAARIVAALGEDCLAKMQQDPSVLDTLSFLTVAQREEIKQHLREHRVVAEVSGLICKEGITPALAAKIVARFGDEAVKVVKEEPYRLTEIEGIGFLTADKVAMAVKIAPDAPARIQAAIRHILSESENEGQCYLRPSDFVKEVPGLLGIDPGVPAIAQAVKALSDAGMLVRDGDDIYLTELYEAEVEVTERIRALATKKPEPITNLDGQIAACETSADITYHPKQREAITMALSSGFSVITGGPGTGKSTITRAIVAIYKAERHGNPIYLCSPTGRAAKRLSEATGEEAKTIHRLLGYIPDLGFTMNEEAPLAPGLLIVDEASMMDVRLARALLAGCAQGMQVVLIGDVDQLPSVGPGSVLRDVIDSGAVPVTRLQYIYRQEEGSGISALAHQINQGEIPDFGRVWCSQVSDGTKPDVFAVTVENPDEALPLAVAYAKQAYEEFGLLGFGVLAPGHKGSAGVKTLNKAIRASINPHAGTGFSSGDKVMVVKNNYEFDVFNGDLGIVRSVTEDGSVDVDFGDKWVTFGTEESQAPLDILQPAFASTIHKYQGSETPVCIVVLTRQHWIMLRRQLIYTAVTRAKKRLVIIHQSGTLKQAIKNNQTAQRNSRLAERLRGEK